MQIDYQDDMKGKHQSVRATTTLSVSTGMGYAEVFLEGLGRNEEEATTELLHIAAQVMQWMEMKDCNG
jgi:ribosome-binding factor A